MRFILQGGFRLWAVVFVLAFVVGTFTGCTWGLPEDPVIQAQYEKLDGLYKEGKAQLSDALDRKEYLAELLTDPEKLKGLSVTDVLVEYDGIQEEIAKLRPAVNAYKEELTKFLKENSVPWWTKVLTVLEHIALAFTGGGTVIGVVRGMALKVITRAIEKKADSSKKTPDGVKATVASDAKKGILGWLVSRIVEGWALKAGS